MRVASWDRGVVEIAVSQQFVGQYIWINNMKVQIMVKKLT